MKLASLRFERSLARIVTVLAAAVSCTLAVGLPTAFLAAAFATLQAEIGAEAKIAATSISQLAGRNPNLWVYENARIRGLLAMLGPAPGPERRIAMAGDQVVAEEGPEIAWPAVSVVSPIYDSGVVVGELRIERPARPLLINTMFVALFAGTLAAVAFLVLRSLPLRQLQRALARSMHLATHDSLTGLPNRTLFLDRVEQGLAWSRRENAALVVLYLDLDRFKEVNDSLGHAAGDQLLVEVANRLRGCVRELDTLARLGGDEFAIVQVGLRQFGGIELLAQRLIEVLDQPFALDGRPVTIGVSIGIAVRNVAGFVGGEANAGALLQEADLALYGAKEEGRGTYRFFAAEMNRRLLERRALEADMLEALEQNQFSVHYQPQLDLRTQRIVGAEALVRWRHPARGEVPPYQFIPLAEETGLIGRIDEWVLQVACRQAAAWPDLQWIAVNVSPAQFHRAGFFDQVQRALRQSGLDPGQLEIEITEGVLLHDTDDTIAMLRRLHDLGVAIAMDDFGTGYSSLGYLQRFRFDKIKIDRSFVRDLETDPHAAEIVRAVLRMSHAMGIRVIAEGVEHEQQASLLREEGCEEVQGFLFSRALPAAEFTELLRTRGNHAAWETAD